MSPRASGRRDLVPAEIERRDGRIFFIKSPFSLKDEIKAMKGSKWHGYEEENPIKAWSVEDCQRNNFQLALMQGEDVFAWFDRDWFGRTTRGRSCRTRRIWLTPD